VISPCPAEFPLKMDRRYGEPGNRLGPTSAGANLPVPSKLPENMEKWCDRGHTVPCAPLTLRLWRYRSGRADNFPSRFANYKLQRDDKLFSEMPMKRTEILEDVSKAGIAWLLLIRSFVLVIMLPPLSSLVGIPVGALNENAAHLVSIIFNVPIIVIAIASLSARAFRQGLQPERRG
jgi:hypothetical protein